jgi:hypothetical protein
MLRGRLPLDSKRNPIHALRLSWRPKRTIVAYKPAHLRRLVLSNSPALASDASAKKLGGPLLSALVSVGHQHRGVMPVRQIVGIDRSDDLIDLGLLLAQRWCGGQRDYQVNCSRDLLDGQ